MKKIVSMILFICLMIGTAHGYTLKVNGFSRDSIDYGRSVKVNTIDRRGYDFLRWEVVSDNVTLDTPTKKNISFTMPEADVELQAIYALKTFTISYDANGGSTPPASQTKTYGKALTLATDVPTRAGYKFLGWATSSSATYANYVAGARFTTEANMTLYAVWSKSYTVTYDANGGSGAPESQQKTAGIALTLSNSEPQRSGYAFLGWSTSKTATSATYIKGGRYTTDANVTLYAVWALWNYSINTTPTEYALTFKDAVELASTGNTITLCKNATDPGDATIPTGKTLTLDLNGSTISTSNNFVTVEGALTIADSSSNGKINSTSTNSPIEVEGTLNITGGTINAESSTNAIYGGENSTITLGTNDGTINTALPSITGSERGILSLGSTVSYYDGVTNGIHATIVTPTGKLYAELKNGLSSLVDPYVTTKLESYYEGKYNSGSNRYKSKVTALTDLAGSTNAVLHGPQVSGKSLVFDGTDDWLSYGVRNYTHFAVEAVFEYNETGDTQVIFGNYDNYLGFGVDVLSSGQLLFEAYRGHQDLNECRTEGVLESGVKYHVLGTYDGTSIKLYLNGKVVASTSGVDKVEHPTETNLVTGVNPYKTTGTDNSAWFNGKLYMSRLYSESLEDWQVLQNYKASMVKDPVDIHTGGTIANGGVCSICSKQYLTISGDELIGMDNMSNQRITEYAVVNDNDVKSYSKAN